MPYSLFKTSRSSISLDSLHTVLPTLIPLYLVTGKVVKSPCHAQRPPKALKRAPKMHPQSHSQLRLAPRLRLRWLLSKKSLTCLHKNHQPPRTHSCLSPPSCACSWSVSTEPSSPRYELTLRNPLQRELTLTSHLQAIPQITNDFNSLSDVGWYGSGYLLTCCAFQLFFGKIYAFFSVKATYIASIVIFMVSSAISGAAPNSDVFIVGRAICGVGAAGMFAGTVRLLLTTPFHLSLQR